MSAAAPSAVKRVEAQDLTRTYGRRYALKKANFTLDAGQITAIIGGNGAGKTTTFNLLARRIRATSGSILFDGAVAGYDEAYRRAVGYLSHASFLYGALTARENLDLVCGLYNVSTDGVTPILERVGLSKAANRSAREFSRGMVQRLALGRLLITDPAVWLLDEPASGLDEPGRRWLASEIRAAAARQKVVALSSHSRELVGELAQHAVVLSRGRVVHTGPVADKAEVARLFGEVMG